MTLVWLIYFSFAELLSLLPSQATSCILVDEKANTENYSGNYPCASMHEAIFRFVRYIWDNSGHDNVVAFGTILIAIFTYVLYRSTNKLWEAGEKQFVLARAEYLSANRPHIRLKHIWLATPDGQRFFGNLQATTPVTVRLDTVNTGNTTGFVSGINFVTLIVAVGTRLPQRPPYNEPGTPRYIIDNFPLESGKTLTHAASDGLVLNNADIANIIGGTHRLYFIGTVEYWWGSGGRRGIKNNLRQTAFCRYLCGPSGRFEKDDDHDYEYQD
jgi:hypothetical protein